MTKTLTAVAAAALIAAVTVASTPAEARKGGAVAAGILGGIAAGALIAGATSPYWYGPGPYYAYGPGPYGPGCVIRRERVWDGWGWRWQRVRVCY
jgi:hypothetical protein